MPKQVMVSIVFYFLISIVVFGCDKKDKQASVPRPETYGQQSQAPVIPAEKYDYTDANVIVMSGSAAVGKKAKIGFALLTKEAGEISGVGCKNGDIDPGTGVIDVSISPDQVNDVVNWQVNDCHTVIVEVTKIKESSGFACKLLSVGY